MEKARLNYSFKRVVQWVLLNCQSAWFVPAFIRWRLLKLGGGVKIQGACFIGAHVSFDTLRPDLITIGKGCVITSGTRIISHFLKPDANAMFYDKVIIGNRVFVGMNTLIVNSVKIGNDAVIGAGSVVIKDIGDGEIWAGNPAKFIRKRQINEV